jgi:hypothetical protein
MSKAKKNMGDDNSEPHFISLDSTIGRGITVGHIASAIAAVGVFTWDRYGRFIKAPNEGATGSVAHALDVLADYAEDIEGENGEEYRGHVSESYHLPINRYGWMSNNRPDFAVIHCEWVDENADGVSVEEPHLITDKQPAQRKVIAALFLKAFGKERLEATHVQRNDTAGAVMNELTRQGYTFDKDTLGKVIKDLPLPDSKPKE